MAVTVKVVTGLLPQTLGGTVDLTSAGLGTVDAAIFYSDGSNSTVGGVLGCGFWDGTNQYAVGISDRHNIGTSDSSRAYYNNRAVVIVNNSQTISAEYSASAVTDGVRLTMDYDSTGTQRDVTAVLFSGLPNAHVGELVVTSSMGPYDVTAPGFKPHMVFIMSANSSNSLNNAVVHSLMSLGVAHNNSSDVVSQMGACTWSRDNQGTMQCNRYLSTTSCLIEHVDVLYWTAALSDFDANGFSLTFTGSPPGSDKIAYLAIELDDADDAYVGNDTVRETLGTKSVTGLGIQPQVLGTFNNFTSTLNNLSTNANLSIGVTDGTTQVSHQASSVNGGTNSDTDETNAALTINVVSTGTENTSVGAVFDSFDSDGFTLDYTTVNGSALAYLYWAIGPNSSGAGTNPAVDYQAEIDALSPDYRWSFDGDHLADTGATNMTNSGMATNGPPLCEGVTASVFCNGTADTCTGPDDASTADAVNDLCYAGWFMVSDYQRPPFRIFGDGNATNCFQIVAGFGNSVQFDLVSPSDTINVVANQPLVPNREYHLTIVYDDTNKLYGYVDGVAQTITEDDTGSAMTARTGGVRCGGSTGTGDFRIGGSSGFRVVSGVNAYYNEWATWQGTIPTATEIREVMFEKGASPDVTITNQAGLDALADTVRGDAPLCIRVDAGGPLSLTADNVTFDPLASIHVQWMGTGTLNWTNTNGSNASIGSTPNGGTLNFINPATLTINGLINGAEVRIYDNEVANVGNNDTELAGIESNSGTTFVFAHSGAVNTIVLQMMADGYEEVRQNFTLGAQDQTLTLNPIVETNA